MRRKTNKHNGDFPILINTVNKYCEIDIEPDKTLIDQMSISLVPGGGIEPP